MRAALKYSAAKDTPNLLRNENHLFVMIKMNIDRDSQKYAEKCETNKANASKRWMQSHTTVCERIPVDANCTNKNKSKNNVIKESIANAIPKKKFDEFKNVMLKDIEFEKLMPNTAKKQKNLSNTRRHIEMKGYKAKSHYLAIKKWVVLNLREQKLRESKLKNGGQTYAKLIQDVKFTPNIPKEISRQKDFTTINGEKVEVKTRCEICGDPTLIERDGYEYFHKCKCEKNEC
ncbi:MAG: hypothetical protein NkDv07_0417 [Candidatus Improbicoccus devescovinae]|nr:MAG: hypothetical protein NkDv07_0417 [Candidatus Improbicoccus devescovinae]